MKEYSSLIDTHAVMSSSSSLFSPVALMVVSGALLCSPPFVGTRRGWEGFSSVGRFLMEGVMRRMGGGRGDKRGRGRKGRKRRWESGIHPHTLQHNIIKTATLQGDEVSTADLSEICKMLP